MLIYNKQNYFSLSQLEKEFRQFYMCRQIINYNAKINSIIFFYYQKMKRQYSFNQISRITMGAPENQNKAPPQPYYTSSKPRQSWTDMRVEQIKKKYDTPSHRKNYSNFGNNERSKDNQIQMPSNNPYSSYRSPLRDSLASGNVVRKDRTTSGNSGYKQNAQYKPNWEQNTQNLPRFSYDTKQNGSFMEKFSQIKNSMKPQQKSTPSKDFTSKPRQVTRQIPRQIPRETTTSQANNRMIDPRVQNIDKINLKIKKILDCLNENEKFPRNQKIQQKQEMRSSLMKGSIMSKQNQSDELEQTKILSRQKIGYERQQSKTSLKKSLTNIDRFGINTNNSYQKIENTKIQTKFESKYDYNRPSNKSNIVGNTANFNWNFDDKYGCLKTQENCQYPTKNSGISNNPYQYNNQKPQMTNTKVQDGSDSWFQPNQTGISKNRSRSCLNNFKEGDIKLNSGKKLDDQISKINVRIRQFEEQKKKLNIDFKPYNCELRYNRSSSNLTAENKTQRSLKPPLPRQSTAKGQLNSSSSYIMPIRSSFPQKMKTESSSNEYLLNRTFQSKKNSYEFQSRYTFDTNKNLKPQQQQYNGRNTLNRNSSTIDVALNNIAPMFGNRPQVEQPKKYENREVRQTRQQKQPRQARFLPRQNRQSDSTPQFQQKMQSVSEQQLLHQKVQQKNLSNELKQKTQQGIEERKRKLLETATVSFSRETKRLISNLFEQVKLDQELRNAKIWLRDLFTNDKWDMLKKQAQGKGILYSREEFQVTEEEDNPFYSVRESQQSFGCLVNRWIKSENYWKQNIKGQFNLREFQVEKFTEDKVDLEKKGYFVVEDLVRFLNMQTGTFYRNRDLVLVFRRLTNSEKLSWPQFLQKLDQEQTY